MTTAGEQRAATALRGALLDLRSVHALLDDYDATRDKKKLTEVSIKMKEILPTIKELSVDPECKTKSNAPLLIELSAGMKEAVARTKNFSAEAARPSLSSATSSSFPSPSPAAPQPLSRHAASGWLNKLGDKGLIKSWKKRWFAQKAERLYYYETREEAGLKGFVDLTLVAAVAESPKTKHGFELRTKDRIYYLQASSDDERSQWMQMLSSWLDGRGTQQGSSPGGSQAADGASNSRRMSFSQQTGNRELSPPPGGYRTATIGPSSRGRAETVGGEEFRSTAPPPTVASAAAAGGARRATAVLTREISIERTAEPPRSEVATSGTITPGTTPGSFREEEIRALQQKLLSLEAKLDNSSKSVPTRSPVATTAAATVVVADPPSPSSPSSSSSPSSASSSTSFPSSPSTALEATTAAAAAARPSDASASIAPARLPSPPPQDMMRGAAEEQLRAMEAKLAAAEETARHATARLQRLKEKYNATKHQLKTAEQRVEGLAEDVSHLTKETRAKDEHIASLRASASAAPTSAPPATSREQLEDTIAQLRQATHAHQSQNAYLASEIKKLQRNHAIEVASKDEQLDGLRTQLESARNTSSSDGDTQAEFAALQRLYFSALAVGIKLNLMLQGQPCNMDAASLWTKAQALNLHFSKWNEWVLARYEEAFDD